MVGSARRFMSIRVHDGLPYVTVTLRYQGRSLDLSKFVVLAGPSLSLRNSLSVYR